MFDTSEAKVAFVFSRVRKDGFTKPCFYIYNLIVDNLHNNLHNRRLGFFFDFRYLKTYN